MNRCFALLSAATLIAGSLFATNANSNMTVSANITTNCIVSAGDLAFGAYDPIVTNVASPKAGTATLSVTCTNNSAATIMLGQGSNATTGSTDAAPVRRLKGALGSNASNNFLSYSLTQDEGGSTVWGNTSGTGEAYTGTGSATSVTVFGTIAGAQNSAYADTYTDTVVTTISF